jgi:hypothetical protein
MKYQFNSARSSDFGRHGDESRRNSVVSVIKDNRDYRFRSTAPPPYSPFPNSFWNLIRLRSENLLEQFIRLEGDVLLEAVKNCQN